MIKRSLVRRVSLFVSRFIAARRFGFIFLGTSKTALPGKVRLNRRLTSINYPKDSGYMSDIVNIWLDDEYGLAGLTPGPKTIVDIGANIGLFSMLARHYFPNAKIFAYEPNPRIFQSTQVNLEPLGVSVFRLGVGNQPGYACMNDTTDSRLASTIHDAHGDVQIESLDAVAKLVGEIDLLKLDCEGAEWDIFKAKEAMKTVKRICMEYHLIDGHTFEDFCAIIGNLGFCVRRHVCHGTYGVVWLDRNAPQMATA